MPRRAARPEVTAWVSARRARRARRRSRWIGCLGALVAANLGVQSAGVLGAAPEEAPPRPRPTVALPAAEIAPPPPPPEPAPTIPEPPAAPVIDERAIGRIEIPRLGLDTGLHEGIEMTYINRGPSHWPGTAMPGEAGNVVVAGHRTTRTKPFRHLDTLEVGDEVVFTVDGSRWVYRVTGHEVVEDTALWITDQTAEPTATLFACHPPGSAKYRWVTRLALDQAASPGATATAS